MTFSIIWLSVWILGLVILLIFSINENDKLRYKLEEAKDTAKAYDNAACKHNARANKLEIQLEQAEFRAAIAEEKLAAMGSEIRELKLQLNEWKRFKCRINRGKVVCKPRK